MSITTDELRQVAQIYRNLGRYATENMLLDAADTICELQAENAKLRELVDYMTPIAWYEASERERDRMRELGVDE